MSRKVHAEFCFKQVLRLEPHNTTALKSLSSCYWQQGNFEAARPLLVMLQSLEPENPDHTHWLDEAIKKLDSKQSKPTPALKPGDLRQTGY